MPNVIETVLSAGDDLKGMVWFQGEADGKTGKREFYVERTRRLFQTIRDTTGRPDLPVLMFQLTNRTREDIWSRTFVRELQREIAESDPNVYLIPTLGLEMKDMSHLSNDGAADAGRRLGIVALEKIYGVHQGTGPKLQTAKLVNEDRTQVLITFTEVTGMLMLGPGTSSISVLDGFNYDSVFSTVDWNDSSQYPEMYERPISVDVIGDTAVLVTCEHPLSNSAYCGYAFRSNPRDLELGDESQVPSVSFITRVLPDDATGTISGFVRSVRTRTSQQSSIPRATTTLNGRSLANIGTVPGAKQMVLKGRRRTVVFR